MYESAKAKLREVKEFAEKHQTLVACSVTGVTAVLVTRKIDTEIMRKFAYSTGWEAGILTQSVDLLQRFIESKGLKEEFFTEFLPSLSQ